MSPLSNIILFCMLIISGLTSIILNGTILMLGMSNKKLRVEYGWFLLCMTLSNFVHGLNTCVLQPVVLLTDVKADAVFCTVTSFCLISCAFSSLFMQPLLALNRYSNIFYNERHGKRFSHRNVLFMISAVNCLSIGEAVAFWVLGDYGRLMDTLCSLDISNMPAVHLIFLFVVPENIGYAISIFCTIKISRHLKSHENNIQGNRYMRSRMVETKQIIKLISLEIVVPMCLEMPATTLVIMVKYIDVPDIITAFAIGLFVFHTVTDPLVVLFVIKPYRVEFKNVWKKVFSNQVEPTVITASGRDTKT